MQKFSILILFFVWHFIINAQTGNIALITEPQIGIPENAENLIRVVNDINLRENISQVIILGNITANGKFDEFLWAQEILDGLNSPYFVVGGEKDYLLSEEKGSEISLLWGEDKNIIHGQNFSLICLNTIIPEYPTKNYINAETLKWFKAALEESNSKRIITFSYFSIRKATNSNKFLETSLNQKLLSFVSKEEKQNNEITAVEGFYLNRKNDWGYLLISTKKDSVFIKKILGEEIKKKIKPEIVKSAFAPITLFESIKPGKLFSSVNVLWSVNFEKTIISSPAYKDERILAGFKDGTIVCFSSGKEKWLYDSHGKIENAPITSTDLLVSATADGDILTLNVNTGPPAQVIGIGENLTGIVVSDNEDNGKLIIAGTMRGNIYCYNLMTQEMIWTNQLSNQAICSPIVYSKNKIFFNDEEGTLYCVSADNGLLIWKISFAQGGWKNKISNTDNYTRSFLTIEGNNLFLIDSGGNLFCIDALLGTVQWNIKNINAWKLIKLNSKKELIVPTDKNKILMISPSSRKILSEIELPHNRKNSSITDLCIIGNNILLSFDDGWIYMVKSKQKPEKIFCNSSAPIVSLTNINGNCLVTDYDSNFTLLQIPTGKK